MSEYSGYDIKQLWQMVDAAKQGLQPSHDQVAALNKAQQMLSGHAQSLETARDQLAARWPPETNAASAAYLTELDRLIAAVHDTALSCAVNVFHINTVSDAIVQAHQTLEPLHNEYVNNEVVLDQYEAEINAFGAGASSIPGGSTIARGTAKLFTSPPVKDGRQDELTKQAQQAMISLSGAAQDGAAYIKPPSRYAPPTVGRSIDDKSSEIGESDSVSRDGAIEPPNIDAPPYKRNQSGSAAAAPDQVVGATTGFGPTLSSFTSLPIQPAPSPLPPVATGPGAMNTIGTGNSIDQLHGLIPGLGGSPKAGVIRGPFRGVGSPQASVIGNISGAVGAVESTPSRANPMGGMLGPQPGVGGKSPSRTTRSRIAGGNEAATMGPQATRRRGRPTGSDERWDPNNPWELEDGVDPVIWPERPPERFDPGPGIIGIDR